MIYKCKNCGSAVNYDASQNKMVCEYCNSVFEVSELEDSYLKDREADETMDSNVYVCSACGATLMTNNVEAATFCAYCGQPSIVFDRVSKVRKPDYIIPFKLTKEEAYEKISEKLKKGSFVPKSIKNISPDVVRGIYIPFSMTKASYEANEILSGKVRSGKSTTTVYYFRHAKAYYDNLPVDCSVKFSDESAGRLEPFPKEAFNGFSPAYLSGFYADMGDEKKKDLNNKIYKKVQDTYNTLVDGTIKASKIERVSGETKCSIQETNYTLVPVWFFACNNEKLRCTIMVNGYTGKVIGAVPVDKAKAVGLFLAAFIPLAVLLGFTCGGLFGVIFGTESDVDSDIFGLLFAGVSALFLMATAKLKSLKKSIRLSSEKDIFDLAKDREEGQK